MIVFGLDRSDEIGRLPPAELGAYCERSPVRGNLRHDFNDIRVRSFILTGTPETLNAPAYRPARTSEASIKPGGLASVRGHILLAKRHCRSTSF
jgi:hypothetical protein